MDVFTPPHILPPPRKGDILFRGDLPDKTNTAVVSHMRGSVHDQYVYAEGYLQAARLLVKNVLESGGHQNVLVYPIIFLYRHHLELALKRILRRSPALVGLELTEKEKEHLNAHRLDWLWQDLKPLFTQIFDALAWDEPVLADVEGADDYIRQLTTLDPESFSFRYPHSKKGTPSLPDKHINIRHFAESIERLVQYIDNIDTATSEYQEFSDEMEAEYAWEANYGY